MKLQISLFAVFLICQSFGQQYDGLFVEKKKVDPNNSVFTLGREFVYNYVIRQDSKRFFIQENESTNFELTQNEDSLKISEVHLTVIKPKIFRRTNKNQTEVIYSYEPNPTTASQTGIVENEINVWIHPPRRGFFRSLETCPFPYLKLGEPIGYQWSDSMSISSRWSDEKWGEWEDRLLLNYDYKIMATENLESPFGEVECTVISAKATSKLGQSELIAHFSPEYGFVRLSYTLFNGMSVILNLSQIIDGPISRDGEDFFENKYQ